MGVRRRATLVKWALILSVLLLSYGPWMIAWARTPDGHVYTGFLTGGADYWSYMSKLRQGWEGSWLWENRMAPDDTNRRFVFPFYLALGHLAKVMGLPDPGGLPVVFYGTGLVLMAGALAATWHWAGRVAGSRLRSLAVFLALALSSPGVFSSGMMRLDMYPAARLYMAVYFPHYWVDFIGLTVAQTLLVDHMRSPDWRRVLGGMGAMLAVSLVHPHVAAAGLLVMALYSVTSPKGQRVCGLSYVLAAGVAALPYTAYLGYLLMADEGFRAWRLQAAGLILPLWRQPLWFGIGIPLALWGAWKSPKTPGVRMALAWMGTVAVLANAGLIKGASEFAIGLSIPAGALAALGIARLPRIARIPALLVSTAGWVVVTMAFFAKAVVPGPETHLSPERLAVMREAAQMAAGTPVLAPPHIAGELLWVSGVRVEYGHEVETPDSSVRADKVRRIYEGSMTEDEARSFLASENIRVVVIDTGEPWTVGRDEFPRRPDVGKFGFLVSTRKGGGLEQFVVR